MEIYRNFSITIQLVFLFQVEKKTADVIRDHMKNGLRFNKTWIFKAMNINPISAIEGNERKQEESIKDRMHYHLQEGFTSAGQRILEHTDAMEG